LRERGTVIYLRASVASILQRTSHDKNRPLLQTADPKAKIEAISRERAPLYQEVAHIIIETGRPNVHSVVHNILSQLQSNTQSPPVDSESSTNADNREAESDSLS
jgi:3-dehydroquinate synthase